MNIIENQQDRVDMIETTCELDKIPTFKDFLRRGLRVWYFLVEFVISVMKSWYFKLKHET